VDIQLLSVTGPGEFFVWQAVGTGGLEFQVDTTDGVDELDAVPLHPGGHSHHNWGFTSNGIVSINLQATARRLGAATNETSIETTVTFHVLPLPDEPESPFALWQSEHWPGTTDPSVIGPDADPDLDGVLNVFEYAFALDPKAPQTTGLPELSIEEVTGESWAVLTYRQAVVATDLQFEPVATADLSQPTWQPLTNVLSPVDQGPYQLIAVRDSTPLAATKSRFFQLRVQFR
jgi:hypothetical protein